MSNKCNVLPSWQHPLYDDQYMAVTSPSLALWLINDNDNIMMINVMDHKNAV